MFTKGKSGNPKGKRKGRVNNFTASAREAFVYAFNAIGGPKALAKWARDNQTDFYKLFARLIPVEVTGEGGSPLDAIKITIVNGTEDRGDKCPQP